MRAMAATVQRLKRFENIRARLELVVPGSEEGRIACERGRWHGDPEPSGQQCRFWRFTARIRAGDPLRTPQIGQVTGQERPKTPPVWPYRDHGPRPRPGSHANVRRRAKVKQYSSH